MHIVRRGFFLLAAFLALPGPVRAGDKFEQDRAREAVQSGQAMSFARVQEKVAAQCDCQLLEAKLHPEKDHGALFLMYEIKALRPDGGIVKIEMNAQTGEILHIKNKGKKD
ncbi:MAG: hypothetical protein QM639_10870 [Rhodocyclaceae bacterium]